MNYGPYMKTLKGDKTRIKGEYYWLKKNNGYILKKWNGYRFKSKIKNQINYKIQYQNRKEYVQKYRKKNREKERERSQKYREKNKEKIKKKFNEKKEEIYKRNKEYREKNKEKIKKQKQEKYKMNKEKHSLKAKIYYKKNKDKICKRMEKYRNHPGQKEINSERSRVWSQKKRDEDPAFRLKGNLRHRLWTALKKQNAKKNNSTLEYQSSRVYEIYNHLESQFTDGMNWENMGTKPDGTPGWDIDHIRPCASFDLNNEDEIYMCFHWSNLQPLWHIDNIKKSAKFDQETFEYEWKGREIGWVKKN